MLIFTNMVKRQGNVTVGIITMCIASVIASIGAAVAYFMHQSGNHFYYIPIIFVLIISIGGFITGLIDLVRGIKGRNIMRDGYKGRCEIVTIGYHSRHSDRTGPYMIVKYLSESNTERLLKVSLNYENAYHLHMGMKIECYIKGEGCYVNTKEEIKILEAPEQMSIKDTFKSLFKDTN